MADFHRSRSIRLMVPLGCLLVAGCVLKFPDDPVVQPDTSVDPDTDTSLDPDVDPDVPPDTDPDSVEDVEDPDLDDLDMEELDAPWDLTDIEDPQIEDVVVDDTATDTFVNPYAPVEMVFMDLPELLDLVSVEICSSTGSIPIPSSTRRSSWQLLLTEFLSPPSGTVNWGTLYGRAVGISVSLFVLRDSTYGDYVVIVDPVNCEGIYVFDLNALDELVVEVPYPIRDSGTLELGTKIFQETESRALMIAGADRCYDATTLFCDGMTVACLGSLENAHRSDAGFNTQLIFHIVHTWLLSWRASTISLQLQDQSDAASKNAIISDGTAIVDSESISILFRDALQSRLPALWTTFVSCNTADTGYTSTCGTTNVQGRASNGSLNPCGNSASASSDRFVLMELNATMRNGTYFNQIVQVIKDVLAVL